ncbi:MAG: PQQ-binding-like beta-propeller repeat protein [Spirochaetaceae bacterium]|jgi:outer membrane protein assembly factor BamB|nr:PQQ-binding-like beta-propeller repeat protein [Spirochaetaceae bacterium]
MKHIKTFFILIFAVNGLVSHTIRLLPAQTAEEIENSLLWRQSLGGAILSVPSAQLHTVTVLTEGGFIRTYGESGQMLWDYSVNGRLAPFLTRSNTGMTFAGRTNGSFFALSRAGRLLWEKRLGEAVSWAPLVGWDGRVFVFLKKRIVCFTASGNQLWEYKLDDQIYSQPAADSKGGFIAVLNNNILLLVNAFGGVKQVEIIGPPVAVLPGVYPEILVLYPDGDIETIKNGVSPKKGIADARAAEKQAAGKQPAGKQDAGVKIAEQAADGGIPPDSTAIRRLGGRPAAAVQNKRHAVVLLESGEIMLWSLDDGKPLWKKNAMLGVNRGRLLFDERGIYMFSMSGAAGWTMEGAMLWNMRVQGLAIPPALSDDGILFTGGSNWLLYAYQVEHRSRAETANIGFPYNLPYEGNYGFGTAPSSSAQMFVDAEDMDDALKSIGRLIRSGDIGTDELAAVKMLFVLANGGDALTSAGFTQRIEAIRLLGFIGTREMIPFLITKLHAERDSNIKAAIVETLGKIGVDPHQQVLGHFEALVSQAIEAKDGRLLSALAEAIGRLCRFSGPPLSDPGIRLLVTIAAARSSKAAAAIAQKQLEELTED